MPNSAFTQASKGDKGDKGDTGDAGVITPGIYTGTITATGDITITHGLGSAPRLYLVYAEYTTYAQGHSEGSATPGFTNKCIGSVHNGSNYVGVVNTSNCINIPAFSGTDNTVGSITAASASTFTLNISKYIANANYIITAFK